VSAMLHKVHTDKRDQLQIDVYLSCPAGAAQGEPGHTVRQLWM
jgi:hypothetical protein